MVKETEVISLRVHPQTRALLERVADQRGLSLAAFLQGLAEGSVRAPSQFDRWAREVEQTQEGLALIRGTEELLELGSRKLEDKLSDLGSELDNLLEAIIEEGGLEEEYEEVDEQEEEEDGE